MNEAALYGKQKNRWDFAAFAREPREAMPPQEAWRLHAAYHAAANQWDSVALVLDTLLGTNRLTPNEWHTWAWRAFEAHDQGALPYGPLRWVNEALMAEETLTRLETKALMLAADGKLEYALEVAEDARKRARKAGADDRKAQLDQWVDHLKARLKAQD